MDLNEGEDKVYISCEFKCMRWVRVVDTGEV